MELAVESTPAPRPDDMVTPTAATFNVTRPSPSARDDSADGAQTIPAPNTAEKRPLPQDASSSDHNMGPPSTTGDLNRSASLRSAQSGDSQDVHMEDDDDDHDGSDNDNESTADNSYRPHKKKRSQRFFCTDFPPCNLSFTRSEHLARHIRKHTGERPFQCHCMRRFSRLDNLRQHAQTVHVNEDIPTDSLAATGTRFQRQIRTDRIRPTGHRPRASTLSSGGSQSRGHSRNVSDSSIGSMATFGSPDEYRRRPQPLAMAQTTPPRQRLSVDINSANTAPPYYQYSPSGFSTPASVFSPEAGSPRAQALQSPFMLRRSIGWGGQNHGRRLSVPSGPNPYHAQNPFALQPSPFMSPPQASPTFAYAHPSSGLGSPPHHSHSHSHSESIDAAEAEWRRRTWHPSTSTNLETRPATSGLSHYQTPSDPAPLSTTQPAAQQAVRLPGIKSFDRAQIQPVAPLRRQTGDMDIDEVSQSGEAESSSKRDSWASMNQNLTQLDLAQGTPPRESAIWRHSTGTHGGSLSARPANAEQQSEAGLTAERQRPPQPITVDNTQPSAMLADQPETPRRSKRQGWYMGPPSAGVEAQRPSAPVRTSPDGSSNSDELQTPMGPSGPEYRPAIMHSDGVIEGGLPPGVAAVDEASKAAPRPGIPPYPIQPMHTPRAQDTAMDVQMSRGGDTDRLDALVAVATSSDQAITQH